jgi:hypothetical protein
MPVYTLAIGKLSRMHGTHHAARPAVPARSKTGWQAVRERPRERQHCRCAHRVCLPSHRPCRPGQPESSDEALLIRARAEWLTYKPAGRTFGIGPRVRTVWTHCRTVLSQSFAVEGSARALGLKAEENGVLRPKGRLAHGSWSSSSHQGADIPSTLCLFTRRLLEEGGAHCQVVLSGL